MEFFEIVQQTNQKIIIVSDGSYHPEIQIGIVAWVIAYEARKDLVLFGEN